MLRAATGLKGDTLQPWYVRAHYKTYDAYGKPRGQGTLEYVWAGPNRWYEKLIQGPETWTLWKTDKGMFAPPGQQDNPAYPASLVLKQIRDPLSSGYGPVETPAYFTDEVLGSTKLSCFRSVPLVTASFEQRPSMNPDLERFCTAPGKPILLFEQSSYNVYFQQIMEFQHRIVAKRILVQDGVDPVADIDVDALQTPGGNQMSDLDPPANAVRLPEGLPALSPRGAASHLVRKVAPRYPADAKQRGEQGTVRLAGVIGTTGTMTITAVLHSPAPDLTRAAEEAVKQWTYSPYLRDGKPAEVQTMVSVRFTLAR